MSRNMVELLLLALLFIGGWFWYDSLRAREHALRAGKGACENDGLQFLDDTVVCVKLRIGRDERGHAALRRTYKFEFSDDGMRRRNGSLVMLGKELEFLYLEPYLVQ